MRDTERRCWPSSTGALPAYRLFMLNAQPGMPDRDGVMHETPFVGVGMRGRGGLRYVPSRLSLVPRLFQTTLPPDVVLPAHLAAGRRDGVARHRGQHPAGGDRGESVAAAAWSSRRSTRRCRTPTATPSAARRRGRPRHRGRRAARHARARRPDDAARVIGGRVARRVRRRRHAADWGSAPSLTPPCRV